MFSYFLRNYMIYECIHLLEVKKIRITYTNLEALLRISMHPQSNYSFKKLVEYFSMDQTKKRILCNYEKYDDILNTILSEKEFITALSGSEDYKQGKEV